MMIKTATIICWAAILGAAVGWTGPVAALGCAVGQLRDHRALALAGDPAAQWRLAEAYYWGLGLKPDRPVAMIWFRRAAAAGSAPARTALAQIAAGAAIDRPAPRLVRPRRVCTLPGGSCIAATERALIALDGPPRDTFPPATRYIVMDRCR